MNWKRPQRSLRPLRSETHRGHMNTQKSKSFPISFKQTGDPFVDAGGLALEFWKSKYENKMILELISDAATLYVNKWGANLFTLFHGSKITHKAYIGNEKIKASVKLYEQMLEPPQNCLEGYCRTCGTNDLLFHVGRDQFSLSGSAALVNFYHAHEDGLEICASCAIKLFFLPFIVLQMGANLALLQATKDATNRYWLKKTVEENYNKIGKVTSDGILKSKFGNPKNALFDIANEIIDFVTEKDFIDQLQLYLFSNFANKVNCIIYVLPNPVFLFLNKVLKAGNREEWFTFVKRHYHIKKSEWDEKNKGWKNKDGVSLDADEYLNNPNDIYEKLLSEKSILPNLRKYAKQKYFNNKGFDSLIATYYVKEVLNMKEEQINLIKKITDVIIDLSLKNGTIKKYIFMIEGAGKAYQLRGAILKIVKDNYRSGAPEPVITLHDYVSYLFPDGQYWGEVRDLMLIYLYERLHDLDVNREEIAEKETFTDEM